MLPNNVVLILLLAFEFIEASPFNTRSYAQNIPQNAAVRIIVSEAADQGLKGMICVAEVLRHRGSIKGFYGDKSNNVNHQPPSAWKMAAKAWALSTRTNFTKGADHFENVRRFGEPWWAKHCVKTYEYKDHVFYKEIIIGHH
jgi:hypothetical protein